MKKIMIFVVICFLGFLGYIYYDKNIKSKPVEEIVNIEEMKALPKKVFKELEQYVETNSLENIGKNSGEFDIRKVNIGKEKELYLNKESYYYVANGNIYMYVEYVYNDKYLCKMTISDNENNIASFSYHVLDKENI